jgi:hypothetical protein
VFLLNSRLNLLTATYLSRHPFYRRYGANLPSSLERFNSRALVYSTRIPVSVCGTGDIRLTTKLLLEAWYHLIPRSRSFEVPTFQLKEGRIYLCPQPLRLDCHIQQTARLTFSVTPKIKHLHAGRGILTSCASTTPYGLALAPD